MGTWFQSQVLSKTSHTPCLVANESPLLILAGDYFTSSTFTGCVRSASAAAAEAAKFLKKGSSLPAAAKRWGPQTSESNSGARGYANSSKCAECAGSSKLFLDKADGKQYCAPCWKAYYRKSPVAGG